MLIIYKFLMLQIVGRGGLSVFAVTPIQPIACLRIYLAPAMSRSATAATPTGATARPGSSPLRYPC